jgi:hypothetical protein
VPFEATFYVKVENDETVILLINIVPQFPLSNLYSFKATLSDFRSFIESLYLGKRGAYLLQQGMLVKRMLKVSGKYAFNSSSKIGKLPVGFSSLTMTPGTCRSLYEEYCEA